MVSLDIGIVFCNTLLNGYIVLLIFVWISFIKRVTILPEFKSHFDHNWLYFVFGRGLHQQSDGAAMGSLLRPILAIIFLFHHKEIQVDNCPVDYKPQTILL